MVEKTMPIEYDIIMDKQLVLAKGCGVINGTDVMEHLATLSMDDRYKGPMKKLVDCRSVDSIRILPEEAYSIARMKVRFASPFIGERCAFVSPKDDLYRSSRAHQALVNGIGISAEVFRRIEDALKWLDVTLEEKHEEWLVSVVRNTEKVFMLRDEFFESRE
jgi:hypothetical protein